MTIQDIITQAANRYGVDPRTLLVTAQIESGLNPNARNPNSSAGGLFQFIDSTARGYGLKDRFDAAQAADAAARLLRDNSNALRARLGHDPSGADLYLAHQQGAGGAASLLADPNAPAAGIVGPGAIRLNGGQAGMTAGQFADLWRNKFNAAAGGPIGGGSLIDTSPARPAPAGMDPGSLVDTSPAVPLMAPPDPFQFVQPVGLRQKQAERDAADQARRKALFGDAGLASLY